MITQIIAIASLVCSVVLPTVIHYFLQKTKILPHYIFLVDDNIDLEKELPELMSKCLSVNSFSNAILFWRRGYNVILKGKSLDRLDGVKKKVRQQLVVICKDVPNSFCGVNIFKPQDKLLKDLIDDLNTSTVYNAVQIRDR